MNVAETQVRRALNIVDSIGRFPARAYLHDPTIDPDPQPQEPPIHPLFPPGTTPARTTNGIGSQLSPALCNVAITLIEHS